MKKNQSVVFNALEDIPRLESEIIRAHILSPDITPYGVLTEYLLYLLEGVEDQLARNTVINWMTLVSEGELSVEASTRIASAIGMRHAYHVQANSNIIQFSKSWYHDHVAGSFLIFRNNLDRIDNTGDVFERNRLDRLHYEGIY